MTTWNPPACSSCDDLGYTVNRWGPDDNVEQVQCPDCPPPDRFLASAPMPADGYTLESEPDDVKGLRLLRTLREFVASPHGVCGIELDGCKILLVRHDPGRTANSDFDPQPDVIA